ncbi:MAG: hypothetical protein CMO80_03135 [Verrucomicrobiales bacterium]|nr:hypothetical protein [Verrucomicrobiales bacterium]|tara:strand:- start:96 stop:737 length:642 start_codon:yes stop_codon:yes gene_type:complete
MEQLAYFARRATLDDLPVLRELWETERLPVEALDKRVTEFQVAHDANGTILAAIGFKRDGEHGLIHSEAFVDFGIADQLRELIWERFETLARNYALLRVWLQDDLMFWKEHGFDPASDEDLESMPESFGAKENQWYSRVLREELFASAQAKQTEMMFRQAMAAEREKTERQVKNLKLVSAVVAFLLFIMVSIAAVYFFKYATRTGYGAVPYSR